MFKAFSCLWRPRPVNAQHRRFCVGLLDMAAWDAVHVQVCGRAGNSGAVITRVRLLDPT